MKGRPLARPQVRLDLIVKWLGITVFIFVIFAPLAALAAAAVEYSPGHYSEVIALLIPTGRRLILLANSLGLSLAVAASTVVMGAIAALQLWRYESGIWSRIRWLVPALTLVPPYIHAMAWSYAVQKLNILPVGPGLPQVYFQGWMAAWWVEFMAFLPLAVFLALIGFKSIEPQLIDAGRLTRPDMRSLTRIILPLAMPMLLAGAGIIFLISIMDYSVPYLYQLSTYPLEIFAEFSASSQPARAFLYSLPLLSVAIGVVAFSQHGLKNVAQGNAWEKPSYAVAPAWPPWFRVLLWAAMAVLIIQALVPLFSLTALTGSWNNLAASASSANSEIAYTLLIGVMAAFLSLPLAAGPSAELFGQGKGRWIWWILVLMPLAIPPPLEGVGLIYIWNRPAFLDIYGSTAMPLLAALVRFTSFAVLVLGIQLRYIDRALVDAARVIQKGYLSTWVKVLFPMLLPGLLAAAGIVFALTTGELGTTLLVAPPGQATLTMRIYNFLHYGATGTVAGLCLLVFVMVLISGLIATGALSRWKRVSAGRGELP